MKIRFTHLLYGCMAAVLAVSQLSEFGALVAASDTNLIANPGFETLGTSGQPTGWTPNAWGSLTAAHAIQNSGDAARGNVSYTKVTDYVSGDAKWYFAPVAVSAGTKYAFSNVYKSTAISELVAQYTKTDGSVSYASLTALPATQSWAAATYEIAVPAQVTKLSVFHIMPRGGELWTDDFSLVVAPQAPIVGDNLIGNHSAEVASAGQPVGWTYNKWGDIDASATYDTSGYDAGRSLRVNVTRYVSGDAKWYFAPVTVEGSQRYTFTNAYKATAPTHTVLQIQNAVGSYSYQYLGLNPASASWGTTSYTFAVPADAAKISVFHVLASVGELSVDAYNLKKASAPVSEPNAISNASVETADPVNPGAPQAWASNRWGTNTAQFSYLNDPAQARTGNRALRIDVTQHTSGDAKWYFAPVALQPGIDYQFSDWYRSNADSRVVLQITKNNGTVAYQELPGAPRSDAWRQYRASFSMPADAASVSVFHLLSTAGWLVTDDFAFAAYSPAQFNRGLVTLTFDDGWEDNIYTAFPIMDEFGYKSNQFYATTFIANSPLGRTYAENTIRSIRDKGHEMGSHSVTHPDLTTLSLTNLNRELADSQSYLRGVYGQPVNYFATPYGAYNSTVQSRIAAYYTLHRTVDAGYNSPDNFNVMQLKVQNVLSNTSAAEVQTWVEKAKADRTWLILVYHRVANDPETYDTTPTLFRAQMSAIRSGGVPVVTMSQALTELQPQLPQ